MMVVLPEFHFFLPGMKAMGVFIHLPHRHAPPWDAWNRLT
jgi:hypothetical protein